MMPWKYPHCEVLQLCCHSLCSLQRGRRLWAALWICTLFQPLPVHARPFCFKRVLIMRVARAVTRKWRNCSLWTQVGVCLGRCCPPFVHSLHLYQHPNSQPSTRALQLSPGRSTQGEFATSLPWCMWWNINVVSSAGETERGCGVSRPVLGQRRGCVIEDNRSHTSSVTGRTPPSWQLSFVALYYTYIPWHS